ncbi:MAG: hypothetical protein CMJ85_07950 [Planctomycetes bacterium]|nr:hypothetical protein [Planctomycetota bacterium]MDP6423738.1 lipopolysaccharide kinase InaA family protein [Planctomycetota bacterium]
MPTSTETASVTPIRVARTAAAAPVLASIGVTDPTELLGSALGDVVRETPLRRTGRIQLTGGGQAYLKTYAPGAGRAGKVAGRRAPAEAEWRALCRLQDAGFQVPGGLCAAWSDRGDRAPSFVLLAGVAAERLDDELGRAGGEAAEQWLVHVFAGWVRRFHDLAFQHRDLYACHVLVEPGWTAPPTLIDLARVRHGRRLSTRRRVKDLAALCYSLRGLLRRSLLLRLYLVYLDRPGLDRAGRRLLGRVLRKARRIAHHVPVYG